MNRRYGVSGRRSFCRRCYFCPRTGLAGLAFSWSRRRVCPGCFSSHVSLRERPKDPYLGLLTVFALPGVFFLGLFLIPLGMWLNKRRHAGQKTLPATYQKISLDNPQVRRFLMFLLIATAVNVLIAGQLTSRAVTYMEGDQFCGQTCHVPMQPEYTAYVNSNHARVNCTDCHVGEGAQAFIKSKISGTRQLLGVMTGRLFEADSFSRARPASGARNLREVPLAESVRRRHLPGSYPLRG